MLTGAISNATKKPMEQREKIVTGNINQNAQQYSWIKDNAPKYMENYQPESPFSDIMKKISIGTGVAATVTGLTGGTIGGKKPTTFGGDLGGSALGSVSNPTPPQIPSVSSETPTWMKGAMQWGATGGRYSKQLQSSGTNNLTEKQNFDINTNEWMNSMQYKPLGSSIQNTSPSNSQINKPWLESDVMQKIMFPNK